MSAIETLTRRQQAGMARYRDRWLAAGLSTEPADRAEAEAGVREAYRAAGLEPPRLCAWFGSPLAGCLAAHLLSRAGLADAGAADRVPPAFFEQVSARGAEILQTLAGDGAAFLLPGASVVWSHVRTCLWRDVRGQIWDRRNLGVRRQVIRQARNGVDEELAERLRARPRDAVRHAIQAPLADPVDLRVGGPVRAAMTVQLTGRLPLPSPAIEDLVHHTSQGQFDASWLAAYDYLLEGLGLSCVRPLAGLMRIARSAGLWWPFPGLALLTERPDRIARDAAGRLHDERGPAVRYPDGWGVYAWHGIRVDEKVIVRPETLTIDEVRGEGNVERRRVLIERYGFARLLREGAARTVHRDDFGALYRLELPGDEPLCLLKVVNATREPDGTFKDYFLRVPPWIGRAREAVAWTFGMGEEEYRPGKES